MGYGNYDMSSRVMRATTDGYHTKSQEELFTQSEVHEKMNPKLIKKRECRDSEQHPNTVAIILAMDETGSMGRIPHNMVQDGLPNFMDRLLKSGLKDAAVCLVGVGDHKRDSGPLQIGQFESGDKELDEDLTRLWLEGNGGGNGGESYALAWLFAARYTEVDSFIKRGVKGYLFTIGDEPCHEVMDKANLKRILNVDFESDLTATELLEEAKQKFNVYHIYVETGHHCQDKWRERLGKNFIEVHNWQDIPDTIAKTIVDHAKITVPVATSIEATDGSEGAESEEEMLG